MESIPFVVKDVMVVWLCFDEKTNQPYLMSTPTVISTKSINRVVSDEMRDLGQKFREMVLRKKLTLQIVSDKYSRQKTHNQQNQVKLWRKVLQRPLSDLERMFCLRSRFKRLDVVEVLGQWVEYYPWNVQGNPPYWYGFVLDFTIQENPNIKSIPSIQDTALPFNGEKSTTLWRLLIATLDKTSKRVVFLIRSNQENLAGLLKGELDLTNKLMTLLLLVQELASQARLKKIVTSVVGRMLRLFCKADIRLNETRSNTSDFELELLNLANFNDMAEIGSTHPTLTSKQKALIHGQIFMEVHYRLLTLTETFPWLYLQAQNIVFCLEESKAKKRKAAVNSCCQMKTKTKRTDKIVEEAATILANLSA